MLLDVTGRPTVSEKKELRTTNRQVAKFAAYADDVFRQLQLTVVCLSCGGTPQMQNHPSDSVWKMECACTVRVLQNPEQRM